ncbi:MAG TPA: hypothetical protein VFP36_04450, partial [Usitatibacter sp.]|nr:hypothetical protein [Usitatibacter sp.]
KRLASWCSAQRPTPFRRSVCEAFCTLVREADAMPHGPLDDLCAASMNNFVSAAIGTDAPLSQAMAAAIEQGAIVCRRLWARAGTWVNEERADYLCALAFARLGKHAEAREAALRGLGLIESGGSQEVDEAFLLLELAHAGRSMGLGPESRAALERAHAIARRWTDAGLREWFGRQSAKRELPALA